MATGLATVEPSEKCLAGLLIPSMSNLEPFIRLHSMKKWLHSQKDLDLHQNLNKDDKKLIQRIEQVSIL
jgi:hypothetical protein